MVPDTCLDPADRADLLIYRKDRVAVSGTADRGRSAVYLFMGHGPLPVLSYRKFLRDLLSGRKRDYSGRFKGFENLNIMREGIPCRPFMLNVGDGKDEKDDRLLYWDIQHPLPEWHEGMKLWVSTFDKSVCDWRLEA